jgi:phage/plasmid-associated DNA primase
VFLQEPNPDEKIKAGIIKEMTRNDRMYMRQLFRSGTTMAFKAKIVLVCNNIIEVPGMDSALRRRVVVIPFTSTFLDQREYNLRSAKGTLNPDAKIIDPAIESKLLSCSDAFMYLLCKRYRESSSNFGVPQIIQDTTEDYLTRNNYQLVFIKRFLHTIVGQMTATTEIYEMFKDWFKRSYPGKRVADLEVFTTELTHEGYIDNGNGIIENIFVSYNGDLISHD